ncbi:DEAD/DEAH box helicase, partial [Aduncisulcus paluster]
DRVAGTLAERGYPAEPIHGDLSQARREDILMRFRKRRCKILVATDVAARGIDVPDLSHVVNFALPQDPQSFVHRITKLRVDKKPLPTIDQVIDVKKSRMGAELSEIVEAGKHLSYLDLAHELLEGVDPIEAVAALLKHSQGGVLDKRSYRKIEECGG